MASSENLSSGWGVQHSLLGLGEEPTALVTHFPCAGGKISMENKNRLVGLGLASLGLDVDEFEQSSLLDQSKMVITAEQEIYMGAKPSPESEALLLRPKEAVTILSAQLNLIDPKRVVGLRAALVPPAAGSLANRLITNTRR